MPNALTILKRERDALGKQISDDKFSQLEEFTRGCKIGAYNKLIEIIKELE